MTADDRSGGRVGTLGERSGGAGTGSPIPKSAATPLEGQAVAIRPRPALLALGLPGAAGSPAQLISAQPTLRAWPKRGCTQAATSGAHMSICGSSWALVANLPTLEMTHICRHSDGQRRQPMPRSKLESASLPWKCSTS
jgi:hypothetical protein